MKRNRFFLTVFSVLAIVSLTFSGCNKDSENKVVKKEDNTSTTVNTTAKTVLNNDDENVETIKFKVNSDMPNYSCSSYIAVKDKAYINTEIIIKDTSSDAVIQKITPPANSVETKAAVYVIDINFDGNMDLLIPIERASSFISFNAYVWDVETNQFDELPSFQGIRNPAFDKENKQILSHNSSSQITSYSINKIEGNNLVFVGSFHWQPAELDPEKTDNAENQFHCIETTSSENKTVNDFYVPKKDTYIDLEYEKLQPYFADGSLWDLGSAKWKSQFIGELKP